MESAAKSAGSGQGAYLDHAATTPLMPEVLDAMLTHLGGDFANPSGIHRGARLARRAVDDARDELAAVLGCEPGEIVFTSGGTEADNLAILGTEQVEAPAVLVSSIEHHAVLRPADRRGARHVPVDARGIVDIDRLEAMLDPTVGLVSIMAVNNEVGTVQPISRIVELVRDRAPQAIVHCDGVQALAWCDMVPMVEDCDLVSVSAHKVGGPKGAGALVVRGAVRQALRPILVGGPQERELRAGTENVAGIVGLARGARLTAERRIGTVERVGALRDRFVDALIEAVPHLRESASRGLCHAGIAHLAFPGTRNEELLLLLDEQHIAASAGSACASGAIEPSHVLLAMGMPIEQARSCIRFTLGATTTADEIDYAIAGVVAAHERLTETDPVGSWENG